MQHGGMMFTEKTILFKDWKKEFGNLFRQMRIVCHIHTFDFRTEVKVKLNSKALKESLTQKQDLFLYEVVIENCQWTIENNFRGRMIFRIADLTRKPGNDLEAILVKDRAIIEDFFNSHKPENISVLDVHQRTMERCTLFGHFSYVIEIRFEPNHKERWSFVQTAMILLDHYLALMEVKLPESAYFFSSEKTLVVEEGGPVPFDEKLKKLFV
jgi:hypothetical protein